MPRNGSGVYSLPQAPFSPGTVISSSAVNSDLSDIAAALTGSLPRDGQAGMTGQLKLADGSAAMPGWAFSNETSTGFSRPSAGTISVDILGIQIATITSAGWVGPTQSGTPIGTVVDFAGTITPAQWLQCFGQAISRTTYAALFAIIGTTYGVGDGSTTFNLPDLRGRATFGNDNMGGTGAGRITVAGGNFDGTITGNSGGSQNQTLSLSQIPTGITSTVSVSGTLTGTTNSFNCPTGNTTTGGGGFSCAGALSTITVGVTASGSMTGSSASNNTGGNAHTILSPALILLKIIYAGV